MRATRVALVVAVLLAAQFAVVIGFRAFVYADMYIAPDAPYGISDVIELVLGVALLALGAIAVITALTLVIRGPKSIRVAGALLGSLVLILGLVLDPLHTAAAKWSARHERVNAAPRSGLHTLPHGKLVSTRVAHYCAEAPAAGEAGEA